jgi:hypothetical protein
VFLDQRWLCRWRHCADHTLQENRNELGTKIYWLWYSGDPRANELFLSTTSVAEVPFSTIVADLPPIELSGVCGVDSPCKFVVKFMPAAIPEPDILRFQSERCLLVTVKAGFCGRGKFSRGQSGSSKLIIVGGIVPVSRAVAGI